MPNNNNKKKSEKLEKSIKNSRLHLIYLYKELLGEIARMLTIKDHSNLNESAKFFQSSYNQNLFKENIVSARHNAKVLAMNSDTLIQFGGILFAIGRNRFNQYGCNLPEKDIGKICHLPIKVTVNRIMATDSTIIAQCNNNELLICGKTNKIFELKNNISRFTKIPNHNNLVILASDYDRFYFKDQSGKIYACGLNKFGQLGTGDENDVFSPMPLPKFSKNDIIHIAIAITFTLFLDNEGNVYRCGQKFPYKTGSSKISFPKQVKYLSDIISIATGWGHAIALDKDGNAFVWGKNDFGQLGLGHKPNFNKPRNLHLSTENPVKAIFTGVLTTFLILSDNKVFAFGCNINGELGLGHFDDALTPEEVSINSNSKVIFITAGYSHTVFQCDNGDLFASGCNDYGQLCIDKANFRKVSKPTPMRFFNEFPRLNKLQKIAEKRSKMKADDENLILNKSPNNVSTKN